ncbi:MAG: hypothetical protein LC799_29945, partial [Actinobacteria bacterium]|nr:hypothetical protein [Actinomycetota bacterium]
DEELYDGVPVFTLPILEVDVPNPTHLQRSLRYPNEIDIDPAAAIEAALDPHGLVARDPKSRTGEAIRIIGYSPTADRVLLVVLLPHEHPPQGRWHLVTAWPASRHWREAYSADNEEA